MPLRTLDAFYQQRSVATAAGSILVAAVDGKGLPPVKPSGARPRARLTKRQKGNKKRKAPGATAFTPAPWGGAPQQRIENPFPTPPPASGDKPPPPPPD